MIVGSRTLLHLTKKSQFANKSLFSRVAACNYSSASSADEYHSLNDQLFHEMQNPVAFQGDKAAIFDNTECLERRFVPFEIKEVSFKCGMGIMGTMVWGHMY